ncbi:MAG: hypothetical protein V3V14_06575 [Saprospiraceae bacterium]
MIRLGVFVLAIPIFYFLLQSNLLIIGLVFLVIGTLFVWAVLKQQKFDNLAKEQEAMIAINQNEIDVLTKFQNIYDDGSQYIIPRHRYIEDLDIFGSHSIFFLVNRCKTYFGNQILSTWFKELPSKSEVHKRQEAIKEVAESLEWRQELAVKLFALQNQETYNVSSIVNHYLQMDLSFATNNIINTYRRLLPLLWLGLLGLMFVNPSLANSIAILLFIGNLLIVGKYSKQISEIQSKLAQVGSSLKGYISAIKTVFDKKWNAELLQNAYATFKNTNTDIPIQTLKELNKIVDQLDYRLNLLVAIVANGVVLWDLSVVNKLEKWKIKNKDKMESIFYHIGFMETISSLSTWAYNHPESTYPSIGDQYMQIATKGISHPLIPRLQNVDNDYILSTEDHITIITGSNMSGKSTFLRTLGINMILGFTGTKVSAQTMEIPLVKIVTYMRIKDALEENVSTFKAELNRIELILDILKNESDTFILIDEMLRGTNSRDKLSGSIGLTKKLLRSSTYAMIATHDIKLAEIGELEKNIANYYFDIDYKDGNLVFDYKIKKGICRNFNATFLLNQLGIETKPLED